MRLPLTVRDIDVEWLSAALGTSFPDLEVRTMRVRAVQFSTATRVLVDVDYGADAQAIPAHLCVKGGFDCADYARKAVVFRKEALAYADVLPLVSVHRPACYFSGVDQASGQGVVILEDVVAAGGTTNRALEAPTIDAAAEYLDTLAALHSSTWDSPRLADYPWLTISLGPDDTLSHWWSTEQLEYYLDHEGRAEVVHPLLQDPTRLLGMLHALAPIAAARPRCILHGDPHIGNTYRSGRGEAAFLDWQGITQGPWARDVSYFMSSNLTIADRRAHERDLLAHYLERLAAYGVPTPTADSAWTEYRRWLIVPLLIWIGNSDLNQPATANRTGAERCSTAMIDLDALELFVSC
jgi:aminoglycoside/choline kinase family phosphotransferase